jgi:hypothetical protein
MAIKYQDIKEIMTLSTIELKMVSTIEKYIDDEILNEFDITKEDSNIFIEDSIIDFDYNPFTNSMNENITTNRKKLMSEELKKRYIEAGWKFIYLNDESYYSISKK